MKKFLALIFLILPVPCQAQSARPIRVVQFIHPPFVYQAPQSGELKGAEIDYQRAILKDAGYEPSFELVPFTRMLKMLETGEADIGPLLTKTPERQVFAFYSSAPVITMSPVLVVLSNSPLRQLKTLSDLKPYRIGFSANQTLPVFFRNHHLTPFDLAIGANLTEQNLKKLLGNRFDAFIELNPYNAEMVVNKMGVAHSVRYIVIPGSETQFYVILSRKSPIAPSVLKEINSKIETGSADFMKYLQKELK